MAPRACAAALAVGAISEVATSAAPENGRHSENRELVRLSSSMERLCIHRSAAIDGLAAGAVASVGNDAKNWILRFSFYRSERFMS